MTTTHRIGFHVSIAGGLPAAVERARERQCTAAQIFCGNPRGWALSERSEEEVRAFCNCRREADLDPVVVHASYLVNPCSPDPSMYRKTSARLRAELDLAGRLAADLYVLHPGSAKGEDMNEAVERAATCISRAIVEAQFTAPVLLEGMAGVYGPGGSWGLMRELADRIVRAAPIAEVGLTLDTAHAWARGYDFRDPGEVQRLVDNIDGTMGMEALRLVHLNDSKEDCGNGRDRHQHLGEGQIGRAGLGNVLAEPRIAAVPLIMETPWVDTETDVKNLQTALDLLA